MAIQFYSGPMGRSGLYAIIDDRVRVIDNHKLSLCSWYPIDRRTLILINDTFNIILNDIFENDFEGYGIPLCRVNHDNSITIYFVHMHFDDFTIILDMNDNILLHSRCSRRTLALENYSSSGLLEMFDDISGSFV